MKNWLENSNRKRDEMSYWYFEMLKLIRVRNVNELKTYFWKKFDLIERALKWKKENNFRCEETELWRFVENMKKNWNSFEVFKQKLRTQNSFKDETKRNFIKTSTKAIEW